MRTRKKSFESRDILIFGRDTVLQVLGGPLEEETRDISPSDRTNRDRIFLQANGVALSADPLEIEVEVAIAPGQWVSLGTINLTTGLTSSSLVTQLSNGAYTVPRFPYVRLRMKDYAIRQGLFQAWVLT